MMAAFHVHFLLLAFIMSIKLLMLVNSIASFLKVTKKSRS